MKIIPTAYADGTDSWLTRTTTSKARWPVLNNHEKARLRRAGKDGHSRGVRTGTCPRRVRTFRLTSLSDDSFSPNLWPRNPHETDQKPSAS